VLKFRERREYAIQANWKVVVENFLECYRCAVSHPGFADLIDLDYEFFFSARMPEEEQRAMVDFIDQVQREAIIIVESVQRGSRSGFHKQGQLILSRENRIQHFQKLVFSALTDSF